MIPEFRSDGYLPDGLHLATEADVTFSWFEQPSASAAALRVRRWVELARIVGARRILIDGSFVTATESPNDVDSVILLPDDFQEQINREVEPAIELEQMPLTRHPEEIFAAEDEADWSDWVKFFSRTREDDGRTKGLVEITI
jgi:hypothetical protein